MTWNNEDPALPGVVATAAWMNQLFDNMRYAARGSDSPQTEVDIEVELAVGDYIQSTTNELFELRKEFTLDDGNVAEIVLRSDNFDVPSSIEDGAGIELQQSIGVVGGAEQDLSLWEWIRTSEGQGLLMLAALGTLSGVDLVIDEAGNVGVECLNPQYPLDVESGEINVSGDYRSAGAVLTDFTETLGSPNKLSTTKHVNVSAYFRSTLAIGTKPIDVSSTTECPALNAEMLDGFGWHSGLQETDQAGIGVADTDIVTLTLDGRIGEWTIMGVGVVVPDSTESDKDYEVKLFEGATQIGETDTVREKHTTSGIFTLTNIACGMVCGPYTATTGTEVVKLTCANATGAGTSGSCTGYLLAFFEGP